MIKRVLVVLVASLSTPTMVYSNANVSSVEEIMVYKVDSEASEESTTYYIDPIAGDIDNDGSEVSPWNTLQGVFGASKAFNDGDKLILLDGNHGRPYISNYHFETGITIVAASGATPHVDGLQIANSDHLTFDGLFVDGSERGGENPNWVFLITGDVNTSDITLSNCTVKSADDISTWTTSDWYEKAFSGVDFRGTNISIDNSLITNVYHAVSLRGSGTSFSDNMIDNFGADALQVRGSNSTYENNLIRDAYIEDYDINHDDALQFFSLETDPLIENVTIRNNKFLLFEDEITEFMLDQKTAGYPVVSEKMQGIIITDGYGDNWVVENNLVVNANAHGISLYGARNCRVQNNTVLHHPNTTYFNDTTDPQILLIDQSKTGQSNFSNIIRNNLSTDLSSSSFDETSTVEGNIDIDESSESNYLLYFDDYLNHDFHLKLTSPALDAGVNTDLATTDLEGRARLNNDIVDVGAYELDQDGSSNLTPELATIGHQSAEEGVSKDVALSATDADGDDLSFSLEGVPNFVTLEDNEDGTGKLVINPAVGDAGDHTFSVKVSDGELSDEEEITVTVTSSVAANEAPVLANIGNKSVKEGVSREVSLTAADADGDILSYSLVDAPNFVSLTDHDDGTGKLIINANNGDAGSYIFSVEVSDGIVSDQEEIVLTVSSQTVLSAHIDRDTNSMIIYPNPSQSGIFFIKVEANRITSATLRDLSGRRVDGDLLISQAGADVTKMQPSIQLLNQPYILSLRIGDKMINQMLIVN